MIKSVERSKLIINGRKDKVIGRGRFAEKKQRQKTGCFTYDIMCVNVTRWKAFLNKMYRLIVLFFYAGIKSFKWKHNAGMVVNIYLNN